MFLHGGWSEELRSQTMEDEDKGENVQEQRQEGEENRIALPAKK